MDKNEINIHLISATSEIVSAYVANHNVDPKELPELIQTVYSGVSSISQKGTMPADRKPAVPVEESVKPDYIVCLNDGMQLRMLKRHIKTSYGMTPAEYREYWGLPLDYPMVAPNYAEHRSRLARENGLGKKRGPRTRIRLHNVG